MKHFDIIIVGAGASGIMTALALGNSKKSVALLEAGFSVGKKLLVTGNGRCNITNMNMSSKYFNKNIDNFLSRFNENDLLRFLKSIGLETYSDECGRVYPVSNSAKSVVDVLVKRLRKLKNIDVFTDFLVDNIALRDNKYIVSGNNQTFECEKIVISTGNIPNEFINRFSKNIIKREPSLVALKVKENTKNLDGIRVGNVKVTARCKGKMVIDEGEVLFKDSGISGICIFNVSTLYAREKTFSGEIEIDLLPQKTVSETVKMIKERCGIFDEVGEIFTGLFVDAVREEIFRRTKINEKLKTNNLTSDKIKEIANLIHGLKFTVVGNYNNNQVISGGVDLEALNEYLEYKGNNGLFFTGEVVDVDGECGGYNLQWAWTSGYLVGNYLR